MSKWGRHHVQSTSMAPHWPEAQVQIHGGLAFKAIHTQAQSSHCPIPRHPFSLRFPVESAFVCLTLWWSYSPCHITHSPAPHNPILNPHKASQSDIPYYSVIFTVTQISHMENSVWDKELFQLGFLWYFCMQQRVTWYFWVEAEI